MTAAQFAAVGRHVVTFLAGGVTFLAALHVISSGDAQTIGSSLTRIGNDVADITAALAPVVGVLSAWWAAHKQGHKQQIAAVNAIDGVKVVSELAPGKPVAAVPKI